MRDQLQTETPERASKSVKLTMPSRLPTAFLKLATILLNRNAASCSGEDMMLDDTHGRTHSSPAALRIVTVRDLDALRPHQDVWDRLAWEAPQQLPTLLSDWVNASFRHGLRSNEQWLCSFAYDGDRLVGVLPVFVSPHPVLGPNWPQLRTCDRHTHYGDIVLAPDQATAAFNALLAELGRQVPNHLGLDLARVRQDSPIWTVLEQGLEGYVVRRGLLHRGSVLNVTGDFDSYLAPLGNMRSNLKRYRKKLERRGRVSTDIRTGSTASADFLDEFLMLEASGWKGRSGTALLNQPDSVPFHMALIRNFAAQERLEWHTIRVDDHLVAARMALRCGNGLLFPKIAFDEAFAECRPGSILTEETLRNAFSRPDITELDFVTASEAHRFWHFPQREYVDVHLVRGSVYGLAFQLPGVLVRSAYQTRVRPRIPTALRTAWRQYRRRGDRKPRRTGCA